MPLINDIILGSWIVFAVYWLVSAFNVKKDLGPGTLWRGRLWRILRIAVAVILTVTYPSIKRLLFVSHVVAPASEFFRGAGAVLTVFGLAIAVWARVHLGRNWSFQPAVKENHELVTSGPYSLVRNPIYSGMLTALFGSLLATRQVIFLFSLAVMGITFIYRVQVEEKIMSRTFPDSYPVYKERTKALIPFLW